MARPASDQLLLRDDPIFEIASVAAAAREVKLVGPLGHALGLDVDWCGLLRRR
jgi:hypothetical protein